MREIESERLLLNNFVQSDIESFLVLVDNYIHSEHAKYDHKWPESRDELLGVLNWFSNGDVYLAVREKRNNDFIGFVNMTKEENEKEQTYNMGYVFNSKYHGHGYAYEACNAYVKYAFDQLDAKAIVTGTAKENRKSCVLLDKLGFKLVKEEKGNIQETGNGKPIEFIGCIYSLKKNQ